MPSRRGSVALVLLALGILVGAFVVAGNGAFAGTDGVAVQAVQESSPGYQPWFSMSWMPQSTELQSGLFALQAALGAGVVGFVLGTLRERRRHRRQDT